MSSFESNSLDDVHSARFAGLSGLKNGALLSAAEEAGYAVLITADQGFPYQQGLTGRSIALVILAGRTNRFVDQVNLVPAALSAPEAISPGAVVRVSTST